MGLDRDLRKEVILEHNTKWATIKTEFLLLISRGCIF